MLYILYTFHVLTCIFLILVVLLQRGKGADLSVFGGGSTQAAFGARGTATLLHKLTVGFFVTFMFTTIAIALFQNSLHSDSVLSGVADETATQQPASNGTADGETAAAALGEESATEAATSEAEPAAAGGEDDAAAGGDAVEAPSAEAGSQEADPGSAER